MKRPDQVTNLVYSWTLSVPCLCCVKALAHDGVQNHLPLLSGKNVGQNILNFGVEYIWPIYTMSL